ncbi:3-aminobutyryl-CoA ammonia lyase [Paenactinomyces guangxiensis]|uniref:3-aminobutyryl-CoA ammonia lyase n=1 Tax=Paenactinomyces guangxiensis TaxID=1490290 RepID=A0A7W1WQF1_9BACL|nr:3-aminobutyryl-CoA ammonia lyase [Paenactinomyces guangxiensis]
MEGLIRVRMSQADAHYGGNLVDGARVLSLFGDVATEILIRHDGDEGLFVSYDSVEFLAPVYAGDYIEATGRMKKIGNTSRKITFQAYKVIETERDPARPFAAHLLKQPLLVARASGTCVVPKGR